jgi:hypothetical protein
MDYIRQTITATGGTFTSDASTLGYEAFEMYTAAVVTLTGSLSIGVSDNLTFRTFSIRWNANILLGAFTTTICGITITQDQLNQTGTFTCVYDGLTWAIQYFADGKDQPQIAQGVKTVTVPVGGTLTLTAGVDEAYQRLSGPVTLTSNYTVIAGTTGIKAGSQFQIELAGGITIGANTLTIFGISINANQALNGGVIIIATYDTLTTSWIAASTSRPVTTADIEPVAAWSVMGNATSVSATPTDITFSTNYGVLQRSGTTLTTGLLTANNFDSSIPVMQLAVTNLSSAQILASFTTPVQILPAAPNYYIIHKIIVIAAYGGATYTTNLDAAIKFNTAATDLYLAPGLWGYTGGGGYSFFEYEPVSSVLQTPKSSALFIRTLTGNPAAGNGTAQILVYYTAY